MNDALRRLTVLSLVLVLVIGLGSAWWDTDWKNRKQIKVTEEADSNLKNYPVTTDAIDIGSSSWESMRVVNETSGGIIEYGLKKWESERYNISLKVNISSLSNLGSIYVYYNNTGVSAANDSWEMIRWNVYDDFDDGTISNNWVDASTGNWVESGGTMDYDSGTKDKYYWHKNLTYGAITEYRGSNYDYGWNPNVGILFENGTHTANIRPLRNGIRNDDYSTFTQTKTGSDPSNIGNWHRWKSVWNNGSENYHVKDGGADTVTQTENAARGSTRFALHANTGNSGDHLKWDWIKARNYVHPEPSTQIESIEEVSSNEPSVTELVPDSENIDPSSGAQIEVEVGDPDDAQMNVSFYDASDHSQIEKKENVNNGTYTTTWTGLSEDQTYNWYANVTDGTNTVKSNTATFTTIDITLNWNDQSNNENGFRIYSNASGSLQQVASTSANTQTKTVYNTGLEFNKNTTYKITAYNQYGESNKIKGHVEP